MTPGVEFDDQNDIAEYVCGRAENVQDHNGQDHGYFHVGRCPANGRGFFLPFEFAVAALFLTNP